MKQALDEPAAGHGEPSAWRTINDVAIGNIMEFVAALTRESDRRVEIGTDSLQRGKHTEFVTVVAVLNPGKGGRAAYRREVRQRITSLRERLMREVWLSVSLGLELNQVVPASSELRIHIDANPVVKHRSSRYIQELVGMVASQGFRAVIKPDSWAASHAADRVVRALASARAAGRTPKDAPEVV